ncbi:MAG: TrkA family potassium uptake protein [Clostridiales bacterium]|nr:TrkA family potassium uptake protein [Clostridiales bacterium]
MDKKIEKMKDYLVIGLGRFGKSVATTLYSMGNEVLAIDKDADEVAKLHDKVSTAVTADASSKEILYSLGAQNFDCAIICMSDIEASLLATQVCKDLNIPYIIAKAQNEQHGKILSSIGVDLIIHPEEYVGKKLASLLSKPGINELVELTDDFNIFEMTTPESWYDKNVEELNIRRKYGVSIVYIKRSNKILSPDADTKLAEGDILIIAGQKNKLSLLSNLNTDYNDAIATLNSIFDNNNY